MNNKPLVVAFIAVLSMVTSLRAAKGSASTDDLLNAIAQVESGGDSHKVGDHGQARGAFQIHYTYWKDATDFDTTIGGSYDDVVNDEYARKIVMAYWRRYCPEALKTEDFEVLTKTHNAGPKWNHSEISARNTTLYWKKVRRELLRINSGRTMIFPVSTL